MKTHPSPKSPSLASLLFIALASLIGCTSNGADEAGPPGPGEGVENGTFLIRWHGLVPAEGTTVRSIHLNEDKVFVYLANNRCYWLNRASGYIAADSLPAQNREKLFPPVTFPDRIVFPTSTELAVYTRDGRQMHRVPFEYTASSGAAAFGQNVYLGFDHPNGGRISAIETKPQPYPIPPLWTLQTRGQVSATPASLGDAIFAGSRDGGIYAVRAQNREVLWPLVEGGYFKTGGEILADVKADKDGVYASSMDSKLYCLDPNTGRIRWSYFSGQPLRNLSSPVPTATQVFVYVPGQGVACVEKVGDQEHRPHLWIATGTTQFLAADERHVYLATSDGGISAVDRKSGEVRQTSAYKGFVAFATNNTPNNPTIYAASADGSVYALTLPPKPGHPGRYVSAPAQSPSIASR